MSDLYSTLASTCIGDLPKLEIWVGTVVESSPDNNHYSSAVLHGLRSKPQYSLLLVIHMRMDAL